MFMEHNTSIFCKLQVNALVFYKSIILWNRTSTLHDVEHISISTGYIKILDNNHRSEVPTAESMKILWDVMLHGLVEI